MLLLLIQFINILFIDFTYYIIKYYYQFEHTPNTRWFYLHSITNAIISYNCISDIKLCLNDISQCYFIPWNIYSYKVYYLSLLLHIYHILFFKLKKSDYIHHFTMCGICGPIIYFQKNILSSFVLFFLTGFPGMLDYLLLFLVKIKKIHSLTEKRLYLIITTWIRSPGCILTIGFGIPGIIHNYNNSEYFKLLGLLIMSFLVYWNAQYYLNSTYNNYYSLLYITKNS